MTLIFHTCRMGIHTLLNTQYVAIGLELRSVWPQLHALANLSPACFLHPLSLCSVLLLPRTPSVYHFSPLSELPICSCIPPHPPGSLLYLFDSFLWSESSSSSSAAAHNYVSLACNFVSLFIFLPRFESFSHKRLWACLGQNPSLTCTFPWVHHGPAIGWGAQVSDKDDLICRLAYFTECLGYYLKKLTIKFQKVKELETNTSL